MTFTNFNDIARAKNQEIFITHVATGKLVAFPGIITEYQDQYNVNWGEEEVYGRADPIKPYRNTRRQIQIGFKVLSPNMDSAIQNLKNFQMFVKMLYPMYSAPLAGDGGSLGRTIKAPPLLRIKFVNLIQSADGDGALLGCINGISLNPATEAGYFIGMEGNIYPKEFTISFTFTPQHENPLGWDSSNSEFLSNNFPYTTVASENIVANQGGTDAEKETATEDKILN